MNCSHALLARWFGFASISTFVLGCQMDNPAFNDDELGDDSTERGSDSTDEAESATTDEGTTTDASTTSTEGTTDATSDSTTSESTTDPTADSTTDAESSTDNTTDTETDTGPACGEGQTDCEGSCVDLGTDPLNCGGCGSTCNEDELCLGECIPLKYVFVSSAKFTGAMGGIGGADEACNTLADVAGLPGSYFAWNSVEVSYPNLDFVKDGAYRRTDGHIVADSYADLTDGSLLMPINLDENQLGVALNVAPGCDGLMGGTWSNTTPFGEYAGLPNCSNWTSSQGFGRVGSFMATDGNWSQFGICQMSCAAFLPIYCVQQDP